MKVSSSSLAVAYAAGVTAPRVVPHFVVHRSKEIHPETNREIGREIGREIDTERRVEPTSAPKVTSLTAWKNRIEEDAQALWRALHRLVSVHPLVRSALGGQPSTTSLLPVFSTSDLTQDLYLLLLEKGRFNHYLQSQMSDAEIEREIFQIELTNFLIGRLRRRRPENYRIVRRVSSVLESAPQFKVFHKRPGRTGRYRQAAEVVYGLSEWDEQKPMKDSGTFDELIAHIPMRVRNRRRVGCRGEAQVIVTNQDLAKLMLEILRAIDSPAPLRVLRQLALTKLPVYDAVITSLDDEVEHEHQGRRHVTVLSSTESSPEQIALADEDERQARQTANDFLDGLHRLTRSNAQRTERLWRVLWHCYFDPDEPSQLLIAELVGLSDSSVSDYRRKLETELRKLKLTTQQMRYFTEELDEQLRWRLALLEATEAQPSQQEVEPHWHSFEYQPMTLLGVGQAA
jgi:hypothetical protein